MIEYVLKCNQSVYNKNTGKRPLAMVAFVKWTPLFTCWFFTDRQIGKKTESSCELWRWLICNFTDV